MKQSFKIVYNIVNKYFTGFCVVILLLQWNSQSLIVFKQTKLTTCSIIPYVQVNTNESGINDNIDDALTITCMQNANRVTSE